MTGAEVFLIVIGAWLLVTSAITVGLCVVNYAVVPFVDWISKVRDYNEKRLGDR